jgi:ribonuclease P protein subunit POP4
MNPITSQNLLKHEIIGLDTRVSGGTNKQLVGFEGKIIDETRNTVTIFDGKCKRVVPKDIAILRIRLPDGTLVEVNGKRLVGRPEDRVKMRLKRW